MSLEVNIDNEKISSLYTYLTESVASLRELNTLIETNITNLGESWQGAGYEALVKLYQSLKLSLSTFVEDLDSYASDMKIANKNAGELYNAFKTALKVAGIVNVAFGSSPNLDATGDDSEYETIYGLKTDEYTDAGEALKDAETALNNLAMDIEVLNVEYHDTYANMLALQKAFQNHEISEEVYNEKMTELSNHLKYVNEQLGEYKKAAATLTALTGNNTWLDLIGFVTNDQSSKYQDGKIREGADGFFHWGKDIGMVNEGMSEALDAVKNLDPVSTICDSAAVNGLGVGNSDRQIDEFLEGSGVSQTSMSAAYSVAEGKGETLEGKDGAVFFNSKAYHESGRYNIYSENGEYVYFDSNGEKQTLSIPEKYLQDADGNFFEDNSNYYVNNDRVFSQEFAYQDTYNYTNETYVDENTNTSYDSVMVNVNGETTYMTVSQYNKYLRRQEDMSNTLN